MDGVIPTTPTPTPPSPAPATPVPTESGPHRIGLGQGVALYVCALLGAGVLMLPGQVASLAGPASLAAWVFSALLGLPLAYTFAALATRYPDAGGVATYASRAFSARVGGIAGWWYFIAGSVGHAVVPLTAGYYVTAALRLDQHWAPLLALVVLAVAVAANLAGLRVGARLQVVLAAGVAAVLVAVIVIAAPRIRLDDLTPFAPHGGAAVGQAVVVLFFAFAGWEAIAHLSGEFRDVRRTLPRATLLTVVIITVLYLGLALAVVGTGAYGDPERDRISVGIIVEGGLGLSAAGVVAGAAVLICLGTTNAFAASISRLGFALAREGFAPRSLTRLNRNGMPQNSMLLVAAIGSAGLLGAAVFGWGTEDMVFVPSVLVLATYLIATTAAVRLFRGRTRAVALLGTGLLVAVAPFAGWHLAVPVGIAAAVLLVHRSPRAPHTADRSRAPGGLSSR